MGFTSVTDIIKKTIALETIIPLPPHDFVPRANPGETLLRPSATAPLPLGPPGTNRLIRLVNIHTRALSLAWR